MVDKQFSSVNNVPPEPWTGQDTHDRGMRCLIAPHFLVLSFYRVAQEWCRWLTIAKEGGQSEVTIGATTRITEPFAQPFMSATWGVARPPDPADPTKEGPELDFVRIWSSQCV